MRNRLRVASVLVVCVFLTACKSQKAPDPKLAASLDPLLHSFDDSGAIYAARVVELPSQRELYSHRADDPMIPASNGKLCNAASALDHFGPDHKFKTYLAIDGDDLWLIGTGDPGCGDERLAGKYNQNTITMLDQFSDALKARGVTQIKGNLYFYDGTFDKEWINPGWSKGYLTDYYAAPVSGLSFNTNCVDITVFPTTDGQPARYEIVPPTTIATIINNCTSGKGKPAADVDRAVDANIFTITGFCDEKKKLQSRPVTDPGTFFADALRTNLQAHGITISGKTERAAAPLGGKNDPPSDKVVAIHETLMSDVLWRINKNSNNLFADAMCKAQGRDWNVSHGMDLPGSWEAGGLAIRDFLHRQKIDDSHYVIIDGSGLARGNRVTTRMISDLFAKMSKHKYGRQFRESLSIAFVDGTIGKRLEDLKGRVYAKTGYIGGVRSLGGYVHTREGRWLVFSIIYNQIPGSVAPFEGLQDNACRILYEWPNVEKAKLRPTTRPATRSSTTGAS